MPDGVANQGDIKTVTDREKKQAARAFRRGKRQGYQVVIRIERFLYDAKVGSRVREVLDSPVTVHGNWSLGDYRTAEEADDAIGNMVHIKPPFKRGFCGCENLDI